MDRIVEMRQGFETAYIDGNVVSNPEYTPKFISNNYKEGKKVLQSIEDELLICDRFRISVAFITQSGLEPLLQTLKALEAKGIPGEILTTNYLDFSEPKALEKLHDLKNITIRMYDTEAAKNGFHTKGYIFQKIDTYRIIIGSSNITCSALTTNHEWNTKVVSTEQGEVAKEIISEYEELWNSKFALDYDDFFEIYKERYNIIKHQRDVARNDQIPSIEKYKLEPNKMQTQFINNLRSILEAGEERALLISATGTGKTYASAFAMRELGFKHVLFLVHRIQLAKQTRKSYEKVFGDKVSMGLVGGGYHDYDADYVFATVQTINQDTHMLKYKPEEFDCIVLDEAHHTSANTYQRVLKYFKPKLFLGMTATPDKRDDNIEGRNIYEIFNYQIACEIRLQQAMEDNLLCPFHYFGISDVSLLDDKTIHANKINEHDFYMLTSDERIKHIVSQANYYGYSGDRLKGLIFCSRVDESKELSRKLNQTINPETGKYFRTVALDGNTSEVDRENAFERLAMGEDEVIVSESGEKLTPLDYIFSVEILNEGVDIVEVNQVIMLRPTESPIVFVQQLGRGLRKADGKEFVVILDFIGNYNNNFMIPIALSGDRSYNKDTIRKYVISGNNVIPGASTVHFDEVAKDKIFASIDKIKGMKAIIKESYVSLKNRLGRVPYLKDFYENGEIDPLVIIHEYKTYQNLLENMEADSYVGKISEEEAVILEYLSKTILSGARPYELEILKYMVLNRDDLSFEKMNEYFVQKYHEKLDKDSYDDALDVLQGKFVANSSEYNKYHNIDILECDKEKTARRLSVFAERLSHAEFYKQVNDIIDVGLLRYQEKYEYNHEDGTPFVLYEKYSRRDVSLVMNCGKDISSTMYGMKRIGDDVFIFITYHKAEAGEELEYVEGKPDYADAFEDNMTFNWDSQIGRGIDSSYVAEVKTAPRKHLMVKKSDAESNFYYVGEFDIKSMKSAKKKDNSGKERDITKFIMRMHHPVREDLLRYLQSNISMEKEA
jgi:superfamily II DNA or RNA helicase/HKD family nuclease